jgi:voltage-gated potassium channel Kch
MATQAGGLRARVSSWRSWFPFLVYGPLVRLLGVLVIAMIALVLGYRGLQDYLAQPAAAKMWGQGWKNTLFYDLQLPVLSSAPTQGPGPYPVPLGIARFLAPLSTFLAAAGTLALLLSEQWRRLVVATASRHAIVVGDGPVAIQLARNLRRENKKRKVVVISSNDNTLTQARRNKLHDVRGDPADLSTLRAAGVSRARELFACTSEGTVNAAIVLRARDEVREAAKRPLAAYALVRDAELGIALRARRIGVTGDRRLRLDFFAVEDIAARRLFDTHPLTLTRSSPVHVVISGFGQLGQAVLREVARRRQMVPGSALVKVVIRHATEEEVGKVTDAFPVIVSNCSIRYDEVPELPSTGGYTVYVCLDGDDAGLSEGLAMAHSLVSRRGYVVVCMREYDPFAGVLAARSGLVDDVMGRLRVFGVIQEACVPANIRDDFTEQLARSIHSAYVAMESAKGATPATNPSMVPWERLPENLRQSNVDQAADIGAKMEEIGAIIVPESADAPAFHFTDGEVERLAEEEHDRWMRDKRSQGWTYGQPRDDERKIHPDLQPWAALSVADKDKDRNAIRTLPETLRDAGFQILRLPPDS